MLQPHDEEPLCLYSDRQVLCSSSPAIPLPQSLMLISLIVFELHPLLVATLLTAPRNPVSTWSAGDLPRQHSNPVPSE